jgi:hypothetical protein
MPCLWYIFRLLAHTLVRTRTIPNSNGGFSQSDQTIFYNSFVEFSKNCAGFLWILRCVVLWTFLRVELMCFSLCNDSKTTKFGPSEFIQYIEGYLNKDKSKVCQFDFLINNYKYTSWTPLCTCVNFCVALWTFLPVELMFFFLY